MARPTRHRNKWKIRWFDVHGRRRSENYDDYKVAQLALSRRVAEVEEIRAGRRLPDPPERTFDDLRDLWIEKRVPQKRDGRNDKSILNQLTKHFSGMKLRDIGVEDVDDYVDSRDDIEPKTITNHITLLIAMFHYAAELSVPWVLRVEHVDELLFPRLGVRPGDPMARRNSLDMEPDLQQPCGPTSGQPLTQEHVRANGRDDRRSRSLSRALRAHGLRRLWQLQ